MACKFFGTGNLTKDPERIETQNAEMCKFTVACDTGYIKDGQRETEFITFIAWRKNAENCLKYLKKGSKVAITGIVRNRSYEVDGQKRYVTEITADEIEFLSSPREKEEKTVITSQEELPF